MIGPEQRILDKDMENYSKCVPNEKYPDRKWVKNRLKRIKIGTKMDLKSRYRHKMKNESKWGAKMKQMLFKIGTKMNRIVANMNLKT